MVTEKGFGWNVIGKRVKLFSRGSLKADVAKVTRETISIPISEADSVSRGDHNSRDISDRCREARAPRHLTNLLSDL